MRQESSGDYTSHTKDACQEGGRRPATQEKGNIAAQSRSVDVID